MFTDVAKIHIKSGNGGDGCASFHREKYVSHGGPDGGDGGNGGNVIFKADASMTTLASFRFKQKFHAEDGQNGQSNNKYGKSGEDVIIKVPIGTLIKDAETDRVLADLNEDGCEKVLLHGGRGGRGNAKFATPTRQAPRFSQPGVKTRQFDVILEVKTIADVGLIGLPNVGKSTMLAALTAARPKIANYHFTTLTPNLGVVSRYNKTFVLADIPGLIEGAASGAGLGHDFLRHIERTRMLIHVIDIAGSEGRDPLDDFEKINAELAAYSQKLADLPQIVAANKTDIPGAEENLERLSSILTGRGYKVFPISAAAQQGLDELMASTFEMLDTLPKPKTFEPETELTEQQYDDTFDISLEDGVFIVYGGIVERLMDTTYPDDTDSMRRFQQSLIRFGIIDALRKKGAKQGSTIQMGDWEFEFTD